MKKFVSIFLKPCHSSEVLLRVVIPGRFLLENTWLGSRTALIKTSQAKLGVTAGNTQRFSIQSNGFKNDALMFYSDTFLVASILFLEQGFLVV